MSKPMTDAELLGWRDTLTDLERRLVAAEHDVRGCLGTPDGYGYTMAQRGFFKGRLAALTRARDGLLAPIAREQARRLSAGDATQTPQNGPGCDEGSENGDGAMNGQDVTVQDATARRGDAA